MSQLPQNQPTENTILLDRSNRVGDSALITAVKANDLALVQALIEQGANVNTPGRGGWAPLHHAADRVNQSMALLLLLSGAELEGRNSFLQTPLIVAATRFNGFEMVLYLLECNADIRAQDDEGHSIRYYLTEEEMVCCRNR